MNDIHVTITTNTGGSCDSWKSKELKPVDTHQYIDQQNQVVQQHYRSIRGMFPIRPSAPPTDMQKHAQLEYRYVF